MALATERDKIAHLLRRAGFGVSQAELDEYGQLGLLGAVDRLVDSDTIEEEPELDVWLLTNPNNGNLPPPAVAAWWAYRMLVTRRPLVEKMTLFWHDHFACSAEKVKNGPLMLQHNELLRRLALADFATVLSSVAKDPTMLVFLDGKDNVSSHPNENFARELMELYTMGIGNYTESDVQEAARAFTGWSIDRPAPLEYIVDPHPEAGFSVRTGQHDGGVKTVLGHTGNLDGDDVLRIVIEHPATARNICRKLWEWFAYYQPEDSTLEALAGNFAASGYSVKAVLRQIFSSPQFYSQRAERALYKPPADFVVGTLRSTGIAVFIRDRLRDEMQQQAGMMDDEGMAQDRRPLAPLRYVTLSMANQGQRLLYPPNVAGWDGGEAWINSATMVERIKFAEVFSPDGPQVNAAGRAKRQAQQAAGRKFGQQDAGTDRGPARRGRIPAQLLLGSDPPASVADAVDRVAAALDAPLPGEKRAVIASAIEAQLADPLSDLQQLVYEAARLVFASPEYQFM